MHKTDISLTGDKRISSLVQRSCDMTNLLRHSYLSLHLPDEYFFLIRQNFPEIFGQVSNFVNFRMSAGGRRL